MIAAMAVLGGQSCLDVQRFMAQNHPAPSELVQELQSGKTTDEAGKQLLQLGKSEPNVRRLWLLSCPR